MKTNAWIAIIIIVIIAAFAVWWAYQSNPGSQTALPPNPSSTTSGTGNNTAAFDQSISDGTISLSYPSADFGLAVNPQQILVHSYIPPCDQNFNYCLYYVNSSTYAGTNFESAGIRIQNRSDLAASQSKCLSTQPTGYTGLTPSIATSTDYAVSEFGSAASPLSNAAAGHFANDIVYRVATSGSCYEIETRVGQTDFGNYPSGSIQQFTSADETALRSEIQQVLATLSLASSGEKIALPQ